MTAVHLFVRQRRDGRAYVPITAQQTQQLGVREGGRLIAQTNHGDVLACELRVAAGDLVVHAWASWPYGTQSVRVRLPWSPP